MAGGELFLFPHEISSYNAVDWSEDGNIAVATDGGILILSLQWSPTSLDSKPLFYQSVLPCPMEPNNMLGVTSEQYRQIKEESSINQSQELALDRTICPIAKSTTSFTTYKSAKWSPCGGDEYGKCILATLTLDHRLCLFSTETMNYNFRLLSDLSAIYARNMKLEDLNFVCLKEATYSISAVEMCWSPTLTVKDVRFSILSVCLTNGDVLLWKIKFPCKGDEDCELVTRLQLKSGLPSAVAWCNKVLSGNVLCLAVGFDSGVIQAISVNVNMPTKNTTLILTDQRDSMKVTTLSVQAINDDKISILATKEIFILLYEVEIIYKILRLFSSSHTTGDYNYFASGLSCNRGRHLLSSCDGTILAFSKLSTFECSPMKFKHTGDFETTWSCDGVSWSKCGMFCAAAFKPSNICEDRQLRPGSLEIQIIPMNTDNQATCLKSYLLNDQSLDEISECMEVFRENLWEGKNPLPEINDLFSQEEKWFDFSPKILRVLRYFLLAIQVRIPHSDKEKSEELALSESNINKISDILLCKHISTCLDKVIQIKSQLQNNDLITLFAMINWMDCKQELIKSSSLDQTVKKIKAVLKNMNHKFVCCICSDEFAVEEGLYKCNNGHVFGMCCQTTLPCLYDVRTCNVCKAVAVGIEDIRMLSWVDVIPSKCTLCDGFLV